MQLPYGLGCPMWANSAWNGNFFPAKSKPAAFLEHYASVLNSVEGNTTFYALPKLETVKQWRRAVPDHFRFCFKFPRKISHDLQLLECEDELDRFFQRLIPVHDVLGPFFLQLPPRFNHLERLVHFLQNLPSVFQYAVEVRNPYFYGPGERPFLHALEQLGMDRVVFDTRYLQSHQSQDPDILEAKRKKPKMPVREDAPGPSPFLRFCGNPENAANLGPLKRWAEITAEWIRAGKTPYIFMHQAPDDNDAPALCRSFHELLRLQLPDLPELPEDPYLHQGPESQQLSLF